MLYNDVESVVRSQFGKSSVPCADEFHISCMLDVSSAPRELGRLGLWGCVVCSDFETRTRGEK